MLGDLFTLALILVILALYIYAPTIIISFGGAWVMGKLLRFPSGVPRPSRGELVGIGIPFTLSFLWYLWIVLRLAIA